MPAQWQPDCLRLLVDITRELGEIKAFVLERGKWPVPSLETMVEMLSILRGTNLDASLKHGYVETAEAGETFRIVEGKRFVCYEDAIRNIRESFPDMGDGPLEELQTLVEQELYSKGSAWYSLEEKRVETVSRANANATLGEFDAYWNMTVNSLIKWHDINPLLGYQRPYAQKVR